MFKLCITLFFFPSFFFLLASFAFIVSKNALFLLSACSIVDFTVKIHTLRGLLYLFII